MTDNMNKQRCKLQWHLFFQIQTLSSSSFFLNFVVYMFFDNSIIGGEGFKPYMFRLETLGGTNQLSYKAFSNIWNYNFKYVHKK